MTTTSDKPDRGALWHVTFRTPVRVIVQGTSRNVYAATGWFLDPSDRIGYAPSPDCLLRARQLFCAAADHGPGSAITMSIDLFIADSSNIAGYIRAPEAGK